MKKESVTEVIILKNCRCSYTKNSHDVELHLENYKVRFRADTSQIARVWVDAIQQVYNSTNGTLSDFEVSNDTQEDVRRNTRQDGHLRYDAVVKSCIENDIIVFQGEIEKISEFLCLWTSRFPNCQYFSKEEHFYGQVSISSYTDSMKFRQYSPTRYQVNPLFDFLWRAGSLESTLNQLNQFGEATNVPDLGSWISMNSKGGLDGGWMACNLSVENALKAMHDGLSKQKISEWFTNNEIVHVNSVLQDAGASPPNPTTFCFTLPSADFLDNLQIGIKAMDYFDFPELPEQLEQFIKGIQSERTICLEIAVIREKIIELGIIIKGVSLSIAAGMVNITGGEMKVIENLESLLVTEFPNLTRSIGVHFLKEGFGYDLSREGLRVLCHYNFSC